MILRIILAFIFSSSLLMNWGLGDEKLSKYERYALTHPGNKKRGEEIVFDNKKGQCLNCHVINKQGGMAGPDLSHIGGKFDRPHLIESLLYPSAQIVEGFRTTQLILKSGVVKRGVIRSEKKSEITFFNLEGKSETLSKREVLRRENDDHSLMPADLHSTWSLQEFTDVIAYLESLRSSNKNRFGSGVSGPIQLPSGFSVKTVVTGITGATSLKTLDDGRVFICEQVGTLRVVKDGKMLDEPFLKVPVDSSWERGLLGVTVDPEFPKAPFVYVCYVAKEPYPHHRISRFTAKGDKAVADSEKILFRGDDQRKLGGKVRAGHQGGAIHFGPDKKLYFAIGEQTSGKPAQSLDSLLGKILRINSDGSIPKDNPFIGKTKDKYQAIWALGCRNPYTFAFHPNDGTLLINDVGGKFEEINKGERGANYGWPSIDHGPSKQKQFVGPIHIYKQASISGGTFIPKESSWPDDFKGEYLFADFVHGWIKKISLLSSEKAHSFASGLRRPVDLRYSKDGSLYVLLRNAWVIDKKFEPATGSLLKIEYSELPENAQKTEERVRDVSNKKIQFVRDARDHSAGNLPAYKILTPSATYYLEKTGGGLSSMIDRDGNDWLNFHPKKGSGAGGEYRGFPNAVHQQGGNYFHAKNRSTDLVKTEVKCAVEDHISIEVRAVKGSWAAQYDFYLDHCSFMITKKPQDKKYWILYEGTPGGRFDLNDWWMTSESKDSKPLTKKHEKDIPQTEWIAFGDQRLKRSLVLLNHQDDEHPDYFYQMKNKMTVFGFGRKGLEKYLSKTHQKFSIKFVESRKREVIQASLPAN